MFATFTYLLRKKFNKKYEAAQDFLHMQHTEKHK